MQFTDAEIKRIARQRSDGCSTRYNQIKKELETYNESVTTAPDPDPEEPPAVKEDTIFFARYNMIPREVQFVRRAYGLTFSILFILMIVWIVWETVTGVMNA